ncbi:MAG: NrpR regulatory domain-containing protein [Thermodesulfovibrio sp.]|nr:NrpR regulatory domain-containing protein [Thermodesulfovibrio sp.]MDW7998118.1 NrpR regulatory domain-containing protein [Thermodesulfovibrio sp.]
MNRTLLSILKILSKENKIIGSKEISTKLNMYGINLSERTVRYHLKILDEKGLTKVYGKEGRKITERGKKELETASTVENVGFIINKIETLSYLSDFDINSMKGRLILNTTYIHKNKIKKALKTMENVFVSSYVMSDRILLLEKDSENILVPEGHICIGTVCSVTLNAILLKHGIPIISRFGGVLEVREGEPYRFGALISYDGTSLDPLEIFIRGKMTDVLGAIKNGFGRVLASFREIPLVCLDKVKEIYSIMQKRGFKGIIKFGEPNQPLLDIPVGMDRVGIIVVGGLNPIAAIEENNIHTYTTAISVLHDYRELVVFEELLKKIK